MRKAAESVFTRLGYIAATMDDVARAAGMSKRTLYQLFPSKAALLEAVIEAHLAPLHISSELEDEPDLEAALTGMLKSIARHLLSPAQLGIFRLIAAEATRSPELAAAFHRAGPARGASAVERRLVREVAEGRLRVSSPRAAVGMLFAMAFGTTQIGALLGRPDLPDAAEIDRHVHETVAVFLRGALAPAP
ncbi:MAG TPA: TetR/AcrR family transcriptional regulator [Geminicoccaceae bacterium]|nr:TetR/AcrR family transcriptional regulator [Geminicoccus sp.]HMU51997.1 TetR/AcrR family transcriptional regulator [Geminicoccaceae bacterium]